MYNPDEAHFFLGEEMHNDDFSNQGMSLFGLQLRHAINVAVLVHSLRFLHSLLRMIPAENLF
jgi:hypothetical protein